MMARRLQALIATLTLEPKAYRLRAGLAVGACPRSDSDAVAWNVPSPTDLTGGDDYGSGWEGVAGDRWPARARLTPSSSGAFTTDADYDTGANGPRTARTPTLAAAGLRAWLGLELGYDEPTAATTVLFRVYDGDTGDELAWTGADWEAQTPGDDDPATWNTAQVVQDNAAAIPGTVRAMAVMAWLRTSSTAASPSFYGVRVAYGVRQVSPVDDALFRTLLASLRAGVSATAVVELAWPTGGAATLVVPDEVQPYEVTALEAAYNLTTDPDELTPLGGTYVPSTRLWTPTPTPTAGQVVRLELEYVPDLVVRRHPDLEELASLPAIYLAPSGPVTVVLRSQGYFLIRDVYAIPPTALELPDPEIVTVQIGLRIVAELEADVDRLAQALTRWIATRPDGGAGLGGSRELVSPESGQVVQVRAVGRPPPVSDLLAQGVAETRAAWLLTFARASAQTVFTAPLVSSTGATFDTTPLEA